MTNPVTGGGPDTAQQIIRAGMADELEVGIVPVLFGAGLRLFENLGVRSYRTISR